MKNQSPAITIIEEELASAIEADNDVACAIVVNSLKGPVQKVGRISSIRQLREVYGRQTRNFISTTLVAAEQCLAKKIPLFVVRCERPNAKTAQAYLDVDPQGTTFLTAATGSHWLIENGLLATRTKDQHSTRSAVYSSNPITVPSYWEAAVQAATGLPSWRPITLGVYNPVLGAPQQNDVAGIAVDGKVYDNTGTLQHDFGQNIEDKVLRFMYDPVSATLSIAVEDSPFVDVSLANYSGLSTVVATALGAYAGTQFSVNFGNYAFTYDVPEGLARGIQ